VVRTVALELAGKAAVVQINTDENPRLAERFGIRGIPAMFAIKQGKVIGETVGGMNKEGLLDWFGKYL
jgi:thioredoxin 2